MGSKYRFFNIVLRQSKNISKLSEFLMKDGPPPHWISLARSKCDQRHIAENRQPELNITVSAFSGPFQYSFFFFSSVHNSFQRWKKDLNFYQLLITCIKSHASL